MAERFSDIRSPERQPEGSKSDKLESAKSAERAPEPTKFERKEALELAREKLKKVEQQPAPEPEEKQKPKKEPAAPLGKHAKSELFDRQMQKVRAQLPARSRTFSKVVHNRVVEDVSEFLEDTVLQPPLLIAGSVVGLGLGVVIYVFALVQGFSLSGSEVIIGFAIGWILGMLGQVGLKAFTRRKN